MMRGKLKRSWLKSTLLNCNNNLFAEFPFIGEFYPPNNLSFPINILYCVHVIRKHFYLILHRGRVNDEGKIKEVMAEK